DVVGVGLGIHPRFAAARAQFGIVVFPIAPPVAGVGRVGCWLPAAIRAGTQVRLAGIGRCAGGGVIAVAVVVPIAIGTVLVGGVELLLSPLLVAIDGAFVHGAFFRIVGQRTASLRDRLDHLRRRKVLRQRA